MGVYGSFEDLGLIIGPLVFGYVWDAVSPQSMYVISGVSAFIAIILLLKADLSLKQ